MAKTKNVTREIDPRTVHEFHPKVNVTARPVDTYVKPQLSSGAAKLARSVGALQGIAGGLGQIGAAQDAKAEKEGHEAFLRGDETPEEVQGVKAWFTAQNVKRESYMALKGQADVVKMVPQLEEIVATTSSSAEAVLKLRKIQDEALQGAGNSIGYLERFKPAFEEKSARVLAQVEAKERAEGFKILQDQQTTLIEDTLDGIVSTQMPLNKHGKRMDLQEMLRDPEAYAEFTGSFNSSDASKMLRDILSEVQTSFKQSGMADNSKVSEFFFKRVADRAKTLGLPELLDFANIKDIQGINLSQVMKQDVEDARVAAENVQDRLERQTEVNQIKYRKEVKEGVNRNVMNAIVAIQLANQDNTSEGENKRRDAKEQMDALLSDPKFLEMREFDRQGFEWVLRHQAKAHLPYDETDLSIINEGYTAWAEGRLSPEWVVTHMDSLGGTKASFASKANSVVETEVREGRAIASAANSANFSAAIIGPVNTLDLLAVENVPDYGVIYKNKMAQAFKKAFDEDIQLTPEAITEIGNQVTLELVDHAKGLIDAQDLMIKQEERRQQLREMGKASKQLVEFGELEDLGDLGTTQPTEAENLSEPEAGVPEKPTLDMNDPRVQEAVRGMLENFIRDEASEKPKRDEAEQRAKEVVNKRLAERLKVLKKE